MPFYEGADEPLLGQATDASFVRILTSISSFPKGRLPVSKSTGLMTVPSIAAWADTLRLHAI